MSSHLSSCQECESLVAASKIRQRAVRSLGEAVLAVECPEYEELSAFIDEELSHEAHLAIEQHITLCDLCWRDVEVLQAARSRALLAPRIVVRPGQFAPRGTGFLFGWRKAAVAVTAVAAAAIVFFAQPNQVTKTNVPAQVAVKPPETATPAPTKPDEQEQNIVTTSDLRQPEKEQPATGPTAAVTQPDGSSSSPETTTISPQPAPAPEPKFVAEMRDGRVTVGRLDGRLIAQANGQNVEAQIAKIVEKKLRDGRVRPSVRVAMLPDVMRGPADVIEIKKLSPTPGRVSEPRPVFRWEPVDGASKYRIEVYKLDGTAVLVAETETMDYQPDQSLSGGCYKWAVRARRGELAEWEWSEAASFRVLSSEETRLISKAKREYPDSHLVMGSVYESIGLGDEAAREFKALAAENPGSKLAVRLLAGKAN
ncbi:MAG: hypothetical protein HYX78_08100 [Armatimonadetes bacterium]|nr:hypothetical protein [Armatimonadota bacterium]